MLQAHLGSVWIGSKVAEKVKEKIQMQQKRNFVTKLMLDKRFRHWAMIATPFLVYYLIGLLFSANTLFIIKFFLSGCLYAVVWTVGKRLFDETLMALLPLSIYMGTKVWFYVTWITYIAPQVSTMTTMGFLICSAFLWMCFWKSWRGDPGIIQPTKEQRYRVHNLFFTFLFFFTTSHFCRQLLSFPKVAEQDLNHQLFAQHVSFVAQ